MTVGVIHLDQTAPHAARDRSSYSVVVGYANALGIVDQQEAGIYSSTGRRVARRQAGERSGLIAAVNATVLNIDVYPMVADVLQRKRRVLSKLVLDPQI